MSQHYETNAGIATDARIRTTQNTAGDDFTGSFIDLKTGKRYRVRDGQRQQWTHAGWIAAPVRVTDSVDTPKGRHAAFLDKLKQQSSEALAKTGTSSADDPDAQKNAEAEAFGKAAGLADPKELEKAAAKARHDAHKAALEAANKAALK